MKKLFYIALVFSLFKCSKDSNCSKPKGDVITLEQTLSAFSEIEILENINIQWVKSSEYKTVITTGENFIDEIECTVKDNQLTLENLNTCSWLRDDIDEVDIQVHCPSPSKIVLKGNGIVNSSDTITSNTRIENYATQGTIDLKFDNDSTILFFESGSLDATVTGKTNFLFIYSVGFNETKAKELIAQKAHINNNSWVSSELTVKNHFIIENYTTGEIKYWGNPGTVEIRENIPNGIITKK